MANTYPDFLDRIETAPRDHLGALQAARMHAQLENGYANAPLIREIWDKAGLKPSDIKSLADFQDRAPFIDKDDMRRFRDTHKDLTGGFLPIVPGVTMSVGTTSGTTGDPTPVVNMRTSSSEEAYARANWHMGARPGDYITHMLFTYRGGHRSRLNRDLGWAEICYSMTPAEIPRLAEGSKRYRPTAMKVLAGPFILAFEQYFERSGDDPVDVFSSYKGIIFGGEPLSERLRKLTESWGIHLYQTTAYGEVSSANECRMHDGFHAAEDHGFIETIDPVTAERVPDGEIGELVVTMFCDPMMPLIRYRTGDLVIIKRGTCGCGSTHARFDLLGRATDQIVVEGRSILPREIMGLVESHDEARSGLFQIIRTDREMDTLKLRIGYDPERLSDSAEKLHGRLYDSIHAAIGVPVAVELVDNQDLLKLGPPHKIPRVTKQ